MRHKPPECWSSLFYWEPLHCKQRDKETNRQQHKYKPQLLLPVWRMSASVVTPYLIEKGPIPVVRAISLCCLVGHLNSLATQQLLVVPGFCHKALLTLLFLGHPPSHASPSSPSPIQLLHSQHLFDVDSSDHYPILSALSNWGLPAPSLRTAQYFHWVNAQKDPFKTKTFTLSSKVLPFHLGECSLLLPWSMLPPWGEGITSPTRNVWSTQLHYWIGSTRVTYMRPQQNNWEESW